MKKMAAVFIGSFLGLSSMTHAAGYAVVDLEKVVENRVVLQKVC